MSFLSADCLLFTDLRVQLLTIFEKQMHWDIPVNNYLHQGARKLNVLRSCYVVSPKITGSNDHQYDYSQQQQQHIASGH